MEGIQAKWGTAYHEEEMGASRLRGTGQEINNAFLSKLETEGGIWVAMGC